MKQFYTKTILLLSLALLLQHFGTKAQDAGVTKIITPVNLSCGSTTMPIEVIVYNYGSSSLSKIPVTASITGATTVTIKDTLKKTIAASGQDTLIFKTTVNTYGGGTYTFKIYTAISGDKNNANDTIKQSFKILPFPSAPTGKNLTSCGTGNVNFIAVTGTVGAKTYWYTSNTALTAFAVGDTLQKSIGATTTLYANSVQGSGANYLTTTFSGGNGQVGNMFDIHVHNTINVDSFDVSPEFTGSDSIVLYYKSGSYSGYNNNASAWTYGGKAYVTSSSSTAGNKVRAKFNGSKITLQGGQSYGFCLYSYNSNTMNYTNGSTAYTDTFYNTDLTVYSGIGIAAFPTTSTFTPRDWNGNIYYSTPTCGSSRISVTVTVASPVKALSLSADKKTKGAVNAGTSAIPDEICVGDSLKFDLATPSNFLNSDYSTKWKVSYSMKTVKGTSTTNFVSANPNSSTSGRFTFTPKTADADSLYILYVDATNIVSSCDSIFTRYVHVNQVASAQFSVTNICQGRATPITNSSTPSAAGKLSYNWKFGTGDSSQATTPVYTYASPATYTITLNAYNGGCSSTLSKSVIIYLPPQGTNLAKGSPFKGQYNAGDNVNPDNICVGDTIFYTIPSPKGLSNSAYKSTWVIKKVTFLTPNGSSIKDTATKLPTSTKNATFSFFPKSDADSIFLLQVDVTTLPGNCDTLLYRYIQVNPKPKTGFTFTNACLGTSVVFKDTSTANGSASNVTAWAWTFGDGKTSNAQNPAHSYATAGTYTATLTASSFQGCSLSAKQSVTEYPGTVVKFGAALGCNGLPTTFTDSSTISAGKIVAWKWYLDDPLSPKAITTQNVTHTYTKSGYYTIKLVTTSDLGCKDSLTKVIRVLPRPVAIFSTRNGCVGDVVYTVNPSTDSVAKTKYLWNFGDGTPNSTATIPTHIYSANGTYKILLTVTSQNGCSDTVSQKITPLPEPNVNFFATNACAGSNVVLSDSSHSPNGSTYSWNFGDGSSAPGLGTAYTGHKFTKAGTYAVHLAITNTNGCSDSEVKSVVVNDFPKTSFTTTDECLGTATSFINTTTGTGTLAYVWNFGDNSSTVTSTSPVYKYKTAGAYTVSLAASNPSGCSDSFSKTVNVNPLPNIGTWIQKANNHYGVTFIPADTTIGSFKWYFGDAGNDSSAQKEPYFVYPSGPGTYHVKVSVTSAKGCVATATDSVVLKKSGIGPNAVSADGVKVYPNPFEGMANISYNLSAQGHVVISVYDLAGKEIARIKDGDYPAGAYTDVFDAAKCHCPEGMYILKISINDQVYTTKIENMK